MNVVHEKSNPLHGRRSLVLPPWTVALAALTLYGLTLKHWVTFASLPFASQVAGWDWHPGPFAWRPNLQFPLFLVLTYPLRWLPLAWRPIGLNIFTAACAALTLAILARSVRLLGQICLNPIRPPLAGGAPARPADVPFLSFLPTLFAVLLLAAQMTFWENAVAGTGETIDLMIFALLILLLLEFRVTQNEKRLSLFALVYGVGLANNWALIGFFPCFLLALLWIIWPERVAAANFRREETGSDIALIALWIGRIIAHNWLLARRILVCGVLGLLLYCLIPLLGAAHGDGGFWELLREKLGEQHFYLTRTPRYFAAIAAVMTLVPLLFAAIDWPSGEGDAAQGAGLTRLLFRSLNLACLAAGIIMFFDVRWSPNPRNGGMGLTPGSPGFLTFYYLAALSVGYFSGYVLRIFQTKKLPSSDTYPVPTGRTDALTLGTSAFSLFCNRLLVAALWVAAIALPAILFHHNLPQIIAVNNNAVSEFAGEMAESLPDKPAVVLADDPVRLYLAMGACQSLGLPDQYVFIETPSLTHGQYIRYLADRYPAFRRELADASHIPENITDERACELLELLIRHQPVYALHPGFGAYLEHVCMTPSRLGGYLHLNPTNALRSLELSASALATNQTYWHTLEKQLLASLRETARTSPDARRVAGYYSQALDYWGTGLQITGTRAKLPALLEDANTQFAEAIRLNPNNSLARANQQLNAQLRGAPPPAPAIAISNVIAQWSDHWNVAVSSCGPVDVPDLDVEVGRYLVQHGLFRQAAGLFQRSLELIPGQPVAELDLANTYIDLGMTNDAFTLITDVRNRSRGNALETAGLGALACAARNDFTQADQLLAEAHQEHPQDDSFTGEMAEIYRLMGYRELREISGDAGQKQSARRQAVVWFKKALVAFDEHLQSLDARQVGARETAPVTLRRAEMQMVLTNL